MESSRWKVPSRDDNRNDAMGNDKRRQVSGQTYGPTRSQQLRAYGIFVALVLGVGVFGYWAATTIDQRDIPLEPTAPWAQPGSPDLVPADVDGSGPANTTGRDEDAS
jgi:hypothetical protein